MTAASFNKLSHADATERSVMFAKMQCEGRGTGLEKSDWIDTINRRSTALYGDASPRNFTKTITEDETGRLFFAALKRAGGSEIKPLVEKADDGPQHIGPAHAKMHSLAIDRQRERPISYAAAYSEVYSHANNAALRAAVQREHLQHALAGMHGGVDHSLSIGEAQRKEPAKDFANVGDFGRQVARKAAEAELQKLADKRHAEHPEETAAVSYTKVLTDPRNAATRRAALTAA